MPKTCRDQNITISPTSGTLSVKFNGHEIARSSNGLDLKEANYPVVIYVPLADVNADVLRGSDHSTHCPFKGDASYYHLQDATKKSENAVWYYSDPCPQVAPIAGHVAFWGPDIEFVRKGTAD